MKKHIYKHKLAKFHKLVETLNRLRNVPWYWSLGRDKSDTDEQRREMHREIRNAETKYKQYRSRVIQYISVFNKNANMFQKININNYVERTF
jgi:hypothetical protein